jgi:hypothetical protein
MKIVSEISQRLEKSLSTVSAKDIENVQINSCFTGVNNALVCGQTLNKRGYDKNLLDKFYHHLNATLSSESTVSYLELAKLYVSIKVTSLTCIIISSFSTQRSLKDVSPLVSSKVCQTQYFLSERNDKTPVMLVPDHEATREFSSSQ